MKLHWKILLGMVLGVAAGFGLQLFTEAVWLSETSAAGVAVQTMDPECQRAVWLAPLAVVADIFMRLLKMLIVPLILTSIVSGVTTISGGAEFGRLGLKTLAYYMTTSLLAIFGGLAIVNLFQPGTDAKLGLSIPESFEAGQGSSFVDVIQNMVPPNAVTAIRNDAMSAVRPFANFVTIQPMMRPM